MIINKVPKKIKEFIFIFSFLSIIFMLLHEKNGIHITLTTQISYSVFIIGIFFINLMVFIFLLLYYVSNQRQSYLLILSFAFLSNTYYLLEVAIISLSPIGNDLSTTYQKSNDIAIYYLLSLIHI
uniref:MASE4 domain-containing protein n=1 Tax=Escherichia coli TaxID=562 RepID=UPI00155FD595